MDFHKIWCVNTFWKYVEKIEISLESEKKNEYFTRELLYVYNISLRSS